MGSGMPGSPLARLASAQVEATSGLRAARLVPCPTHSSLRSLDCAPTILPDSCIQRASLATCGLSHARRQVLGALLCPCGHRAGQCIGALGSRMVFPRTPTATEKLMREAHSRNSIGEPQRIECPSVVFLSLLRPHASNGRCPLEARITVHFARWRASSVCVRVCEVICLSTRSCAVARACCHALMIP